MDEDGSARRKHRPAGRIGAVLQNAGWLLGGKGIGAILSLVYLGLATRALGPQGFGQFALILGTAQAVVGFVTFQSWQIVVRYGADHLHSGRTDRLNRLQSFCLALDIASMAVGMMLAAGGIYLFGAHLGWSPELQRQATIFCCILLACINSTPAGMLRLHDRFDIAAMVETVMPVMRMAGALIAIAVAPTVFGFLCAWAVAEAVTATFTWAAAIRVGGFSVIRPEGVVADNEGLLRFAALTNAGSSLAATTRQAPILLVGWLAGAPAAGGYRIAFQLSNALTKFTTVLTRVIFPELMRVRAQSTFEDVFAMFKKTTVLAAVAGLAVMALIVLLGRPILHLVGGEHYVSIYPILLLLGGAAVLDLMGVSFEPALFAAGRAGTAFLRRLAATVILIALILVLVPAVGPSGAAIAALATSFAAFVLLGIAARSVLLRDPRIAVTDYPEPE